jgi:hypothetical protein
MGAMTGRQHSRTLFLDVAVKSTFRADDDRKIQPLLVKFTDFTIFDALHVDHDTVHAVTAHEDDSGVRAQILPRRAGSCQSEAFQAHLGQTHIKVSLGL